MSVKNEIAEFSIAKEKKPVSERAMLAAVAELEKKLSGRLRCLVFIGITEDGKGATMIEGEDSTVVEMLGHTAQVIIKKTLKDSKGN